MYSEEIGLERQFADIMTRDVSPDAQEINDRLNSSLANLPARDLEYSVRMAGANYDLVTGFVELLPKTQVDGEKDTRGQRASFLCDQATAQFIDGSALWVTLRDDVRPYPYYIVGNTGTVGRKVGLLLHAAFAKDGSMPSRVTQHLESRSPECAIRRTPLIQVKVPAKDMKTRAEYRSSQNGRIYQPHEINRRFYDLASRQFMVTEDAPRSYRLIDSHDLHVPRDYRKRVDISNKVKEVIGLKIREDRQMVGETGQYYRGELETEHYLGFRVLEHLVRMASLRGLDKQLDDLQVVRQAKAEPEAKFLDS